MGIKFTHAYKDIISIENLLEGWRAFLKGKRAKKDVQDFQFKLMDNILDLHKDLKTKQYQHGSYYAFNISDPKPRNIHKAQVRDRLLHHAIYKILYPFFDKLFIQDSYSCRRLKGTHKALKKFQSYVYKSSKNHTKTLWILKCDIKKFFASVDHNILFKILEKYIIDQDILWLIKQIVKSFYSTASGKGLPLGNLTSQLLVNIYMDVFDRFMKEILGARHYIRYADDFIILDTDKDKLIEMVPKIGDFLEEHLKLYLHPNKIFMKTISSGVDFLGWVHFPNYRILRTSTKRRMFKNVSKKNKSSYLGMLSHGNTLKIKNMIDSLKL